MKRSKTARADAKAAGAKYYETGIPCKQGHLAPRATLTGTCCMCTSLAAKAWIAQRPDKPAEYAAAYRERNPEVTLQRGRDYASKRWAERPEHMKAIRLKSYQGKVHAAGGTWREQGRITEAEVAIRVTQAVPTLTYLGGYTAMLTLAAFRCTVHSTEVQALPHNVCRGANPCPKCNHMKSRGEEQVFNFLSNLTPAEARNRTIIKPKELDIYLPERKLAVEYCGEYFHSHGDAAEEKAKKRNHAQKYEVCKAQGIRLITLWESEWKDHNYAVRRLLRNAVGKSKGKLMARKCELRRVTTTEARPFYERYHPQGGAGSGEHYALFWKGKMVACMRFVLGANDRGAGAANRTWTLGRYATRITVAGAASRLFKAFLHEHNPPVVKSFSDNRFFEGGMYAQLGFVLEEDVPPDYTVWHPKLGVLPKPHYQRRQIPKRLAEIGSCEVFDPAADPRTEKEMTYLMGARRLYDCGKKRWTYSNPL